MASSIASLPEWTVGDVAFLRPSTQFSESDYAALITPQRGQRCGYLNPSATGHPVIILAATSSHVVVTTVSAYGSGRENGFLAPWRQQCHRQKRPEDFRSFVGCEAFGSRPLLRLEPGMAWPKPKTSWVYIQSVP